MIKIPACMIPPQCSVPKRYVNSETPSTRYNLLSNRLSNPFDDRFDNQLYRVYSRLSIRLYNRFDNRLYRVKGV